MKTRLTVLLGLCCLSLFVASTSASDPVAEYLRRDNPKAYLDNTTRRDSYYSDFRVFRVALDLNNDGRKEILVSSTKDRDGKLGNIWSVYEPAADGFAEAGEMTFSANRFYLGQIDEINGYGLLTFNPAGGGEGTLSAYLFDGAAVREVQIASVTRDSQTGELLDQPIVDKYMRSASDGKEAIESVDSDTLAKQYGLKVELKTSQQAAQELIATLPAQDTRPNSVSPSMPIASVPSTVSGRSSPSVSPLSKSETSWAIPWAFISIVVVLVAIVALVWGRRG